MQPGYDPVVLVIKDDRQAEIIGAGSRGDTIAILIEDGVDLEGIFDEVETHG